MMQISIFEVKDKDEIVVILRNDVWENKILSHSPKGHPEVKSYLKEIKNTIVNPDLIYRSHQRDNVKLFYRLDAGKKKYSNCHLLVVVKYVVDEGTTKGYVFDNVSMQKSKFKGRTSMDQTKRNFSVEYDDDQDILYLCFSQRSEEGVAEEINDEVFVRFDPAKKKLINIEILNFRHRIETAFKKGRKNLKVALEDTLLPE